MLTPEELYTLIEQSRLLKLIQEVEYDNLLEIARLIGGAEGALVDLANEFERNKFVSEHSLASINWRNYVATSLNMNQQQVIQSVAKINNMAPELVEELFQEAGALSYAYDVSPFKLAFEAGVIKDLPPATLARNPQFQRILEAGYKQTLREVEGWIRPKGSNFTGTTAISTGQYSNLYSALDQAYQQVAVGGFTVEQATRNALHTLADDNFKFVEYRNPGKRPTRNHLDVAVRRALLTGINQTCNIITDEMCDDWGAPAVETTAHIGARDTGTGFVNHESWQGRVFSWRGGAPQYPDFHAECNPDDIRGFGGANCRHSKTPFFPGISERAYNPDDYIKGPVSYNSKVISYYSATQEQRAIEREIRSWKRKADAAEEAGLDNSFEKNKTKAAQAKMRDFIKQTGLERQTNRERLVG